MYFILEERKTLTSDYTSKIKEKKKNNYYISESLKETESICEGICIRIEMIDN